MTPPEGSSISVETEAGGYKIVAPQAKSGTIVRYLIAAFVISWLAGWAMGWVAAFRILMSGGGSEAGFLVYWIIGWSVGGVFAFWMLYMLLRPAVPERFTLRLPTLLHDSGRPPFTISLASQGHLDAWKGIFKGRVVTEFSQDEVRTLALREFATGNRLTIDKGARRHELGTGLTEVEREWLFRLLAQKYKSHASVESAGASA